MKSLVISIFIVILISCARDSDPVSPDNNNSFFGIYFLKDTALTDLDIADVNINEIDLNEDAWLGDDDIEFYDFSTHCIYLKKDKSDFFDNYDGKFFQFTSSLDRKPFVVVSGIQRCYIGSFFSMYSSSVPRGPYIDEFDIRFYPDDIIHISRTWFTDDDVRNNLQIKSNLLKLNMFHAGIDIKLTSFRIIENSEISTIEYTIRIANHDQDNLYVMDSDKMGSNLFHYYTNGPDLYDISKSKYYYSVYKKVESPEPYDSWNFEWFTLIKSNQFIERTIYLKGYQFIPNGEYVGSITFSSPKNIMKTDRIKMDGRIWIGSIESDELEIEVK